MGVRIAFNHLLEKNFNKYNILLNKDYNRIIISINDKTDLTFLFVLLKQSIELNEFLPQSIYYIISNEYSITKIKKSFNLIKQINYWYFLDIMSKDYNDIAISSDQSIGDKIIGWEIRYAIKTEIKDEFFLDIEKGYVGLIEKLKEFKND